MREWLVELLSRQLIRVRGESMAPTLRNGQWVVVSRRAYARRPPSRFDVIRFADPRQAGVMVDQADRRLAVRKSWNSAQANSWWMAWRSRTLTQSPAMPRNTCGRPARMNTCGAWRQPNTVNRQSTLRPDTSFGHHRRGAGTRQYPVGKTAGFRFKSAGDGLQLPSPKAGLKPARGSCQVLS